MYLRGSEKTKPDWDLESVYHVVYSQAWLSQMGE